MRMSTKAQYAVRAMVSLNLHSEGAPVTLRDIASREEISLTYLEQLLANHSRSAQTKEILEAFQNLVEMQGSLEGPSPELAGVLDWLQDSSIRSLSLSASQMSRPGGLGVPRYSNLLREAYEGARGANQ